MILRLQLLKGFTHNVAQVELYVPDEIAEKLLERLIKSAKQTVAQTKPSKTKTDGDE
jgi:hypothetical protein